MKKTIYLMGVILLLLVTGCSKDLITDNGSGDQDTGKMLLKFNKTETPANVVSVTATLTRTGYTPITNTLNIVTDTSAELALQNIAVGLWHLKIEAKDNSATVIYRGETDVTIVAGVVTQVSMQLQPTTTNMGSIYILVNWGTGTVLNKWIDYSFNPILVRLNSTLDRYGVVNPFVLADSNKYKMWYLNAGGTGTVGYAESTDGLSWNRIGSQPVMVPGTNYWEMVTICPGPVIKVNNQYWMYYSGSAVGGMGPSQTGLATSVDGINWTKRTNPVLTAQTGWETSVIASDVIKIGNTFYMYYTGRTFPIYKIGLATSTDGINWTKYSGNPILVADKSWEGDGVYCASVAFFNNKYTMVYQNAKNIFADIAFGMATSTDGINWVKESSNPFYTGQNTANHWVNCIHYPYLKKFGNELRIYYSGYDPVADIRTIAVMRNFQ